MGGGKGGGGQMARNIPYIPASRYQFEVNMTLVEVASQVQRNNLLSFPVGNSIAVLVLKHNKNLANWRIFRLFYHVQSCQGGLASQQLFSFCCSI